MERVGNADNKQTKKQRLSHQDPAPLHLTVRFPDVTVSVFFEVPAVAATDVFGHYIFESYADAAALNYARGALFIISVRNTPL